MKNEKRDLRAFIWDILESIQNIEDFIKGYDYDSFFSDLKTCNAVVRSLEVIGEASHYIPDDLQKKYYKIPWHEISGMRNRIAHEYFGINLKIVWKTCKEDLPPLKVQIQIIFDQLQKQHEANSKK